MQTHQRNSQAPAILKRCEIAVEMPLVSLRGPFRATTFCFREAPPETGNVLEVPRDARPGIGIAGDPGDARPNARLEACQL
jgi:hypothetical protein